MSNDRLIAEALAADRVVLSVMGPHAGESESAIFERKIADIETNWFTLWLYSSPASEPKLAQSFAASYALFLAPASKGTARPTTMAQKATSWSVSNKYWQPVPENMSPVTGRMPAYALIVKALETCDAAVNIWSFGAGDGPVRFALGRSTLLAHRRDTSTHPRRMLSQFRRVVAVAKLDDTCAVWVR